MGNLHLVTGYAGKEHITSADQGSYNAAIMGNGEFVLERGNQFAATIVSNNQVRVADGDIMMQGRHIRMPENTYTDLYFDNGTQGYKRKDLIVVRYEKDPATDIEQANLVVIKGTPNEASPSTPEYTTGDIINEHALQNDLPLYVVPFDGLAIQPLECLFETIPTIETRLAEVIQKVDEAIASFKEEDLLETIEEMSANTSTGKFTSGLLTKLIYNKVVSSREELDETMYNLYRMWGSYYDGDLNDLATYGTSIYNTQVGTEKHSPTGRWGFVITFGHAYATTHATQLFFGMTDTCFYYRRKDGDWWSDWGEIAFDNHFADRIKTLEGVLTPTQTGLLSELPTGVFQYWGTYPKDAPFSVPFIVASCNAYNFRMQIASDYTGGYIVHRSRGAEEAEWSDWHTFRTTNNAPSGKGIEFQIVNGELQYRYDKEVWG